MKRTLLATLAAAASLAHAETYHLYYFGGQSNMVGFGRTNELPEDMKGPVPDTRLFFGQTRKDFEPADGVGCWSDLTPGFGVGARTDGVTPSPSPERRVATCSRTNSSSSAISTLGARRAMIPRLHRRASCMA